MDMHAARLFDGFQVGHWTNVDARTGCTVVLPPRGNVAACDIRGSSPGSRELTLLEPDRRLTEIHAVVFTGGSAFGLAAADGVVRWLSERDIGYETPVARVPIVPAAVIFDLGAGRADVRPGPEEGHAACDAATETDIPVGRVGAGTGATVGKWAGFEFASPGGLGIAEVAEEGLSVGALAVVNPVGDVLADDGTVLAGTRNPSPTPFPEPAPREGPATSTVLVMVATRAAADKRDARWLAGRAADGITSTVRPAHTRYDGDVAIAVIGPPAPTAPPVNLDVLGALTTRAVAAAIRAAVVVTPPD